MPAFRLLPIRDRQLKQVIKALVLLLLPLSAWSQVKVNALPSGSTPSSGDYTICDQSGTTNKCTMAQLAAFVGGNLPAQAAGTVLGTTPTGGTTSPTALSSPFSFGTSLYPVYQAYAQANITTTASSASFTCNSGCSNIYVGANLANATAYANTNAYVLSFNGTAGITNITAAATTTGTFGVGFARWSPTSVGLFNTVGTQQGFFGQAAQNNSVWSDQYLPGACDNVAFCSLAPTASNQAAAFFGARSSDLGSSTGKENVNILTINDKLTGNNTVWGIYFQGESLLGTSGISFNFENSMGNFGTAVEVDPFNIDIDGMTDNARIDCGYGTGPTYTNCTVGLDIVNNGAPYETGINFGSTALDTSILTHPPAISMASGSNGQAIAWYKSSGYSTPSWEIYSTNTTNNGNTLVLGDTSVTWGDSSRVYFSASENSLKQERYGAAAGISGNRYDTISSGTVATFVGSGYASDGSNQNFAGFNFNITNYTAGAEYGNIDFVIMNNGTYRAAANLSSTTLNLNSGVGISVNSIPVFASTAPTVASGLGTSPAVTAANTAGFEITAGSGTIVTTTVLSMPTATNGYACSAQDVTTAITARESAYSTTSVTFTWSSAPTSADKLVINCSAF